MAPLGVLNCALNKRGRKRVGEATGVSEVRSPRSRGKRTPSELDAVEPKRFGRRETFGSSVSVGATLRVTSVSRNRIRNDEPGRGGVRVLVDRVLGGSHRSDASRSRTAVSRKASHGTRPSWTEIIAIETLPGLRVGTDAGDGGQKANGCANCARNPHRRSASLDLASESKPSLADTVAGVLECRMFALYGAIAKHSWPSR